MKDLAKTAYVRGFTLVEVIIVMLILSVVMMAAMSLFIPAKRASVVQTNLADVQANLRLALDVMTQDFRTAGFLTANDAVAGYTMPSPSATVSNPENTLTINTRAVSGRYGRIQTPPELVTDPFVLEDEKQVDAFRVGNYAAVVQPVEGNVINNKIYKISGKDRSTKTVYLVNTDGSPLSDAERQSFQGTITGNILLAAPNDTVADLNRTIDYSLSDGVLVRRIDAGKAHEQTQFLARNISAVQFLVEEDPDQDAFKVTIEIEGQTEAVGQDAISAEKTRQMRIVVSLRNV
ncbi:MAG: prepilin-type N-terminal cleavage/methylation domain-containing protein [Deltaproteobacteria bacterium]|jgi:prepilin-type N-terminal cleavage/methylation domain-containing protein|nr:prepilin-type N-terminal cleavage/methylation domain-containing protein [Deltaproteobacteria bacterium]MBW2476343.1 prepilin-type N-terminal cleavage/methylation domain-containing protein [Deltaproteobacteria bacterium]